MPRAPRRRVCRKCSALHHTQGYTGALWYCRDCADTLTMPEVVDYMASPEHVRFMTSQMLPGLTAAITELKAAGRTVIY
jgi:ribosomal protein L37AE/L43A